MLKMCQLRGTISWQQTGVERWMSPFWNCHIIVYMKIPHHTNLIWDPKELRCIEVNFRSFFLVRIFWQGRREDKFSIEVGNTYLNIIRHIQSIYIVMKHVNVYLERKSPFRNDLHFGVHLHFGGRHLYEIFLQQFSFLRS